MRSSNKCMILWIVILSCCHRAAVSNAQIINSDLTGNAKGNIVDLGYARYQGYIAQDSGLEFFLGIRYAAPPRRFQAPSKPVTNRTSVIEANMYASQCLQSRNAGGNNSTSRDTTGSEDCLFLNVWRPVNSSSTTIPVLFWIHGGGYGIMNSRADPTFLQQITQEEFVFVSIEYRLGAFGFLASADVKAHGSLNVGLLDQHRALRWVQEHIVAFGGDPDNVVIFGESAGAGSVMLQLLSYDGSLGTELFRRAIMASPYLPKQYNYDDAVPTKFYTQLAQKSGCHEPEHSYTSVFDCLSNVDTNLLASASDSVSISSFYGTWAFTPVTDGSFLKHLPSQQLVSGQLNGERVMIGNNACEGNIFTPQNITTTQDFNDFVQSYLPDLNSALFNRLLAYYPEPSRSGGLYSSQYGRAARFISDAQFVCVGEWLADSYALSYRYEYAVPTAYHGLDVPNYLPSVDLGQVYPAALNSFASEFDRALISFMASGTPYVSSNWTLPVWSEPIYGEQAIFNVSAAVTIPFNYVGYPINLTIAGVSNVTVSNGIQQTNGLRRCDFWRAISPIVPM